MIRVVEVGEKLLVAVGTELAYQEWLTEPFLEALIEEIADTDPACDHSVGICACSTLDLLEELRGALAGTKLCPACHGDGFVDVPYHKPACFTIRDNGWDCEDTHQAMCRCWHGRVPREEAS